MNKVILISPHFDDAVLSAGQFMADRPDCDVVTVFAGRPTHPNDVSTDYDKKCGFDNANDAISVRTQENDEALALLKAEAINLGFPDSQYGTKFSPETIAKPLQQIIDEGDYEAIYAPLGLGHPDHMVVTDAVVSLETDLPIYLWEDLPLRVVEPELVPKRLERYGLEGKPHGASTTKAKMADKIRALTCYKSQIGTGILDPYLMYVPERFWKYR